MMLNSSSDHCSHEHLLEIERCKSMTNIKSLSVICGICFLFMIGEIAGGIWCNSLAILSDAAHLLSDLAGFFISIVSIYVGLRPATQRHTFGFYRAEAVGALFSIFLIWILVGILLFEACHRIIHPSYIDGKLMLIIASFGFVINLIMGLILHVRSNSHYSSNNSTSMNNHTECNLPFIENMNMKSAFIHILGDLFQSFGVIVSSIIIWIYPSLTIADPICTFIFSILVLATTIDTFIKSIHILMEGPI